MAPVTLGQRLRRARGERSLKSVTERADITPTYLQKLERDEVKKPSPNTDAERVREGAVLEYALSSERLSDDEAGALLEYLDWYRHRKATSEG
jgi:transcriptional regulator with XRE-family HTH domain